MAESMQQALEQAGVTPQTVSESGVASSGGREVNVGQAERWASAIGGGALAV
jgi:hypothetical protein